LRLLDLRAESDGNPRVNTFVRHFFKLLGSGDWSGAAQIATEPVWLFGREVSRAHFAANNDASIGGEVVELKQLAPTIPFSAEEQQQLFGGTLEDPERVCFATVQVGEQPVTYGLVVDLSDASDPRVARLFDPSPFKGFAEQVMAERKGG